MVTIQKSQKGREILDELLSANQRYISGDSESQNKLSSSDIRHQLSTKGQKPVAAIVACADSRVAPEIIFGAGIGRLFVIRNAGNVVLSDDVMGSLEFGVLHLGIPLVVVVGHSKCGAVTAAVGAAKQTNGSHAAASPLVNHVSVIADIVKKDVGSKEEVKDAILTNIKHNVRALKAPSSPLADSHSSGNVTIVGALYDIHSGEVFVVDE